MLRSSLIFAQIYKTTKNHSEIRSRQIMIFEKVFNMLQNKIMYKPKIKPGTKLSLQIQNTRKVQSNINCLVFTSYNTAELKTITSVVNLNKILKKPSQITFNGVKSKLVYLLYLYKNNEEQHDKLIDFYYQTQVCDM